MFRIGLTGGIAAGKSVALARFAELGAVVVDYDALSRDAVAPGTVGLDEVVEAFGPDVLDDDGALDRAALGRVVFGDAAARERLNAIVHPEVRRLAAEREAAAGAADPRAVVVHDIPLLVETGDPARFHCVVVVHTPVDVRVSRLVEGRGLTEDEALARVAAQADDASRLAAADVTLDGSGSPEALRVQVDELWARVRAEVDAEVQAEIEEHEA
ncbi:MULTISPECIES: dephospho-CoA kinase [Cellulosimicrobium]|jgi:dephospho-CoA kinase|uniref:Dephospho-CoA kinase n=1 Tax=Cellulosimicrobium sp. ES-005 TaxID=3163031 RepID=A0AAU8G650_9MICO|nr:dephospho-CoA kinase [Cellulosimicrobium cellulans]MCO7271967.1 dephospho-CoA kinase [Cellulosimicrobium cellulans]